MSANIKMQVKSCRANLVCHLTICPNLHIYILVDNLLKKVRYGKCDPLSDRYGPVNGITFTSLFSKILLKKVGHEKWDPLVGKGRHGLVDGPNLPKKCDMKRVTLHTFRLTLF